MRSNSSAPCLYVATVAELAVRALSFAELVDPPASGAVKDGITLGNGGKEVEVNNPFSKKLNFYESAEKATLPPLTRSVPV